MQLLRAAGFDVQLHGLPPGLLVIPAKVTAVAGLNRGKAPSFVEIALSPVSVDSRRWQKLGSVPGCVVTGRMQKCHWYSDLAGKAFNTRHAKLCV